MDIPNLRISNALGWTDLGALLVNFAYPERSFRKLPGNSDAESVSAASLLSISTAPKYVRGRDGLLTLSAINTLPVLHDRTGNPLGAVIEGARTNLATNSDTLSDATISNLTRVASDHIDPKGERVMSRFVLTTTNGFHWIRKSVTASASTPYALSVFVRRGEVRYFSFTIVSGESAIVDMETGAIVSTVGSTAWAVEDAGDGMYRVHCSFTTDGAATSVNLDIFALNDALEGSYAGAVTKGFFAGNVQIEAGYQPSSYIKTVGSAVARASDNVKIPADILSLIGMVGFEGTIAAECYPVLGGPAAAALRRTADGFTSHVALMTVGAANLTATGRSSSSDYGATYDTSTTPAAFTKGARAVVAYRFTNGKRAVTGVNGITAGADLTPKSYPPAADMNFLQIGGAADFPDSLCIARVAVFNRGLSDANLQALFGA
jgi:hypothetical protein